MPFPCSPRVLRGRVEVAGLAWIALSIYLSVCLSVCLSIYIYIYMCVEGDGGVMGRSRVVTGGCTVTGVLEGSAGTPRDAIGCQGVIRSHCE